MDILGLNVKTFGLMFALNFVAWGLVTARRLKELDQPVDWAWEMVMVALVGGFIGARGYWILQNWDEASDDLLGNVFSGSGLIWYGGLLGGTIAMVIWARWRGFLNLHLLDIAGVGLPLGYAIGRIGCQLSGDGDYGRASDLPWAMPYPNGTVATTQDVHPTPIYESITMGLLALWLWSIRDRVRTGGLFVLYLIIGGAERFLVEFVRRNDDVAVGLTAAQIESLILIAAGLVGLWLLHRRGGLFLSSGRRAPRPATA